MLTVVVLQTAKRAHDQGRAVRGHGEGRCGVARQRGRSSQGAPRSHD